jgi:hypothetical protein
MEFEERLRLFNSKVQLLLDRSLLNYLTTNPSNANIKWDRSTGWESSFSGPGDESIEASVLTIRQFIQNNDPISIGNVMAAYEASGVGESIVAEFATHRRYLNEYLDRETGLSIEEGKQLTNREILWTFVYGGLGHSSEPYYSRHRDLIKTPFAPIARILFIDVLGKFIHGVTNLATVNLRVLGPADEAGSPPPRDAATDVAPGA